MSGRAAPPDARSAFLAREGWPDASLTPLAGDASTRRYHRVHDAAGRTAVLMECGTADGGAREPLAFLRWQRFYADLGLRVPAIVAGDPSAGLLLLEDLGDELLQLRVERLGADACAGLYRRAVALGRRLAEEGTARLAPLPMATPAPAAASARESIDDDARRDPLTPARLALEMDLFLAHATRLAVPATVPGLPALEAARAALDAAAGPIVEARSLLHRLCADVHAPRGRDVPMVLCHRDYHARNLMVLDGTGQAPDLGIIDFQDTRLGPRAYDLASLAWDPYVTLPPPFVAGLVAAGRPDAAEPSDWDVEVRLAAGQRLVKAAGTYAYLGYSCGRTEYLRWLGPALERALERLSTWPPRDALARALAACGLPAR